MFPAHLHVRLVPAAIIAAFQCLVLAVGTAWGQGVDAGKLKPAAAQPDLLSQAPQELQLPNLLSLTEADLDVYLAVSRAFIEAGVNLQQGFQNDPASQGILAAHELSPERMNDLAYSISLAVRHLDTPPEDLGAQYDRAQKILSTLAQNPQSRSMLAQRARLEARMIEDMRGQPEGNLAVVSRRRGELTALAELAAEAAAAEKQSKAAAAAGDTGA